jgi:hypothetical protein
VRLEKVSAINIRHNIRTNEAGCILFELGLAAMSLKHFTVGLAAERNTGTVTFPGGTVLMRLRRIWWN